MSGRILGGIPTATHHSSTASAVVKGAFFALVSVAVLVAAAFALVRSGGPQPASATLAETVVVFVGPASDGAQVASAIAVVDADGSLERAVDPETTCTVPGTSYHSLADAYPFIGAEGLADKVVAEGAGWIDVPLSSWSELLDEQGIPVTLGSTMDVFDGTRLYTFKAGGATVTAETLPAFLKGINFLAPAERQEVRAQLAQLSLERLNVAENPVGVTSNLTEADAE